MHTNIALEIFDSSSPLTRTKMASSALEEKINKIRQQNEEIRRRYEEVEEDKKNAAKLNALVQMVPSADWPERKEPPEFSNPPRPKQKIPKEKHDHIPQPHIGEGKKVHTFAQGEGPPPDPKYNFLADSEREEISVEYLRENVGNKQHNKLMRGNCRKKVTGRESTQKDNRTYKGNPRDEYQPGYEAWRAERNRIDEDRISRQRTAEGNWRREWDNDKMHIDDMRTGMRPALGEFVRKDYERKYNVNGNDHMNQNRGSYRAHRGSSKNSHNNYDNRPYNNYEQHKHNPPMSAKTLLSSNSSEERTVIATDKSLKVTLNQGSAMKGQVMSVKVNSPSIAGTGRVGPRQRTRVTYSHTDAEMAATEVENFSRQKSFEEKSKAAYFNNQKFPNVRRVQSLKKPGSKSPYLAKKDMKREENNISGQRYQDNEFRFYSQRDNRDLQKPYFSPKSPGASKKNMKLPKLDPNAASSEATYNDESNIENSEDRNKENTDAHHDVPKVQESIYPENNETFPENSKSALLALEEPDEECKTTNEIETEKTIEMEQVAETSVLQYNLTTTENIAKDDANGETIHNDDSSCSKETVNSARENPKEKCDLSSEKSIEEAHSQDAKAALNENNKVIDDKLSKSILSNVEQNSSKEECKPSLSNCDNVKDKVADKEQDSTVQLSATDTCSVIEAIDRPVSIDEAVHPEVSMSNEIKAENIDDATNSKAEDKCAEKNSEETVSERSNDNSDETTESQNNEVAMKEEKITENSQDIKE